MGSIYGMQVREKLRQRLSEMRERKQSEARMRRAQQAREKAAQRESYQQARVSRARARGREHAKYGGSFMAGLAGVAKHISRGSYRSRGPRAMNTIRAARPAQLRAPSFQFRTPEFRQKRVKLFAWEQ